MSSAPVPPSAPAPAPVPVRPSTPRLMSLDVLRGITMFWLVGGKAFVVAAATLAGAEAVVYQLNHSAWVGLRYYDLIWPSFMLMVGAVQMTVPQPSGCARPSTFMSTHVTRLWLGT